MAEPSKQLIDELYRQQVLAARAMSPEDKLLAGARLFDRTCRIMSDGIRDEYPQADDARVREILVQRLALARRLEQSGVPVQNASADKEDSDTLACMHDNVSVSADDPICLHPSSFCRFREFCEVIEAARKKRRSGGK